jgi:hypothetical protein
MPPKRTHGVNDIGSQAWKAFRIAILDRDNWICQNCKRGPLTGKGQATMDHIKPRAEGGLTTWENCRCLCRRCNSLLGASTGALIAYGKEAAGAPEARLAALRESQAAAASWPSYPCKVHGLCDVGNHSERL